MFVQFNPPVLIAFQFQKEIFGNILNSLDISINALKRTKPKKYSPQKPIIPSISRRGLSIGESVMLQGKLAFKN